MIGMGSFKIDSEVEVHAFAALRKKVLARHMKDSEDACMAFTETQRMV